MKKTTNSFLKSQALVALIVLLFISVLNLDAQNPRLNKYTFAEGLTFSGNNDYSINLRGYVQPYAEIKNYTGNEEADNLTRFRLRRFRLRLTGDAEKYKIDYRFQVDLSGSGEVGDEQAELLLDAWVRYSITRRTRITFGQRATPTDNRELYMGSQTLQLVERSRLTSAFASIREFGVFYEGTYRLGPVAYLKPSVAITNGDGLNVYDSDFGGLKYGGRLDFLPFGLFTRFGQYRQVDMVRENSPKLVIGGIYSINQGMTSRRGRTSGRFVYINDLNNNGEFDDGEGRLPDYTKYGIDFMLKYKGFSMLGEFIKAEADVPDDINLRSDAYGPDYEVFISNFRGLSGADYARSQMMLGQAFNIQAGYLFKNLWSIDGRYTYIDADKHSFLNNGTFYNRPEYYTIGLSKYFDRSYGIKVQGSFTYVDAAGGINDINGDPIGGDEWIGRIITSLAF
ncbi:MAG: porin [Vicingaceae bacterium]